MEAKSLTERLEARSTISTQSDSCAIPLRIQTPACEASLPPRVPHSCAARRYETATTPVIDGIWERKFRSMPVCNVIELEGHPTHAPWNRT